ncbi:MAG TPA: hypothetical protein VL688_12725 [Verrucomicrobiae bacterium]|jgi:ABC-2 type transport system permease protein|nr:hypothetical protein [Verrucomicrobiae bacterium]
MASPRFKKNLNLLGVLVKMYFRTSDYKSIGGALWSFIGPLTAFVVLYCIFEARFGKSIPDFPLHLLVGIIPLTFFNNMMTHGMRFFEKHRDFLLNSHVPAEILLVSSLFVPALKFAVEISLCAVAGLAFGVLHLTSLPLFYLTAIGFILLVFGITLHFLILSTLAGDVMEIWTVLWPMMLFITPTFYTVDMLSPWARLMVLNLNPLTPVVLAFQSLMLGHAAPYFSVYTVVQGAAYMTIAFVSGYSCFKRFEKRGVEMS